MRARPGSVIPAVRTWHPGILSRHGRGPCRWLSWHLPATALAQPGPPASRQEIRLVTEVYTDRPAGSDPVDVGLGLSESISNEWYDPLMAAVSVVGDDLVVEVTGFDRFRALNKRGVTVPLERVVTVGEGVQMGRPLMPGLPWLANSFPGLFTVGSYRRHGKWTFWVVHDPKQAVLITLRDEHYSQLVIGVDDPRATIALVNGALNSRGLN